MSRRLALAAAVAATALLAGPALPAGAHAPDPERSSAGAAAAASGPLTPGTPRCVRKTTRRKPICGGAFRERPRRGGWWPRPLEFKIIDLSILGRSTIEDAADDETRFRGDGEVWISARSNLGGRVRLPVPDRAGVAVSAGVAKGIDWTSQSAGSWATATGETIGCGVAKETRADAPTGLAGVFSAVPGRNEIRVQWSLAPAAYRCPPEAIDNPTFPGLPTEAMTMRYRASAFRGARFVKLPVKIDWQGFKEGSRMTVEWSGHVTLQRVR